MERTYITTALSALHRSHVLSRMALRRFKRWNRKRLKAKAARIEARRIKNLPRPPTAAETAQAVVLMKTVRSYIGDWYNSPDYKNHKSYTYLNLRQRILGDATRVLKRARAIDPNATYYDDSQEPHITYTIDQLTAELFYYESVAFVEAGDNAFHNEALIIKDIKAEYGTENTTSTYKTVGKKQKKHYLDAIKPAELAYKYTPLNAIFLQNLAYIYKKNRRTREAKDLIHKALKKYPTDIELIKFAETL